MQTVAQQQTLQHQFHHTQETERKKLVQLCNVAATELGWKNLGLWEQIKTTHGGHKSLLDMTKQELEAVLAFAKTKGFKVRHATSDGGKSRALSPDAQVQVLRGLWLEMHALGMVRSADESALASWVSNSRNPTVTAALGLLTPEQLSEAIERLKNWRIRRLMEGYLFCPTCGYAFKPTRKQAQAYPRLVCDRHAMAEGDFAVAYQWSATPKETA